MFVFCQPAHPGAPDSVGENGYNALSSPPPVPGTDASVGTDQEYWPPPPPPGINGDEAVQTRSEGVGTDVPPSPTTSTASASSTSSSRWVRSVCTHSHI